MEIDGFGDDVSPDQVVAKAEMSSNYVRGHALRDHCSHLLWHLPALVF